MPNDTNAKKNSQSLQRTRRRQRQQPPQQTQQVQANPQMVPQGTGNMGGRGAVRESRIKDRPQPKETRDSSLKIKVELDLEAEVDLYARVKGDVTVGLM